MKKLYKPVLILVSIFALGGIIAALYLYNLKPRDLQKAKPDYEIAAPDLLKAFESDENAATVKYVDMILEVSGSIRQIESGENNTINISLESGSEFSSVICTLQGNSDLFKFKIGDIITIRGNCSGYLLDVLLNNCVVVK